MHKPDFKRRFSELRPRAEKRGATLLRLRWLCLSLLLMLCWAGGTKVVHAEAVKADPAVTTEVVKLLKALGYVPGLATDRIDEQTEAALRLFNQIENPPKLSGIGSRPVENLVGFRDALREILAKRDQSRDQATIFVEMPHGNYMSNLVVDKNGTRALSSDRMALKVWDARTGRQLWSTETPTVTLSNSWNIGISDDGKHAFTYGSAIRVYDAESGNVLRAFWADEKHPGEPDHSATDVVARPGTTELVVGQTDGAKVVVFDWQTGKLVAELGRHENGIWLDGTTKVRMPQHWVTGLDVSPDGRFAASTAYDFGLRVWDLERRRLHRFIEAPPGVRLKDPIFLANGRTVAALADNFSLNKAYKNTIYFMDINTGAIKSQQVPSKDEISIEAFDGGKSILVKSGGVREFRSVYDAEGHATNVAEDNCSLYPRVIAGSSNLCFGLKRGRLAAQQLSGSDLFEISESRVDMDDLVRRGNGASSNILGRDGNIFLYDFSSGTISKAAQLKDDHGHPERDIRPVVVAGDGRFIGLDGHKQPIKVPPEVGKVHSASGELLCQMPPEVLTSDFDKPIEETSIIFDYAPALDIAARWVEEDIILYNAKNCQELRRFSVPYATKTRPQLNEKIPPLFRKLSVGLRFSSDGRTLYAWRAEDAVQAFDSRSGKRIAVYRTSYDNGNAVPEFAKVLAQAKKERLLPLVSDVRAIPNSKRFVVLTGGTMYASNARHGLALVFEEGNPRWFAGYDLGVPSHFGIDPTGTRAAIKLARQGVSIRDLLTGKQLQAVGSEPGQILTLAYSPDGKFLLVIAGSGVLRVYDAATGELLATTVALTNGEWLSITPEGFFASSPGGENLVRLKRNAEMFEIKQVYQALYRPDLVEQKLKGDRRGLVKAAAAELDLDKVLASGGAPKVSLLTPRGGAEQNSENVTGELELVDGGGGVGKVEWRVNGVTIGVDNQDAPPGGGPVRVKRDLILDTGENAIEVVAYNRANLVASLPATVTVKAQAPAGQGKPRLVVLAAGINDYADARLQLNFAVADAQSLADALTKAGNGVYAGVEVTLLRDKEVTREGLNAAFAAMSKKVRPGDVFVFYVAGHGKTIDGRYYFGQQDIEVTDLASIAIQGIAQDEWQKWFARIPARKSVLLFDTCESGSLTTDAADSNVLAQQAASGRLAQATGRTILTASSSEQLALEGVGGHGLFTYQLLDALGRADSDGNGMLELTELAAFVYSQVSLATNNEQVPQVRIGGADYSLVKQTAILAQEEPQATIPTGATHIVSDAIEFQIAPQAGARRIHRLEAQTPVALVNSDKGWVLVAKEGKLLGYVPQASLRPIQSSLAPIQ
jgi:WD40 repeat protein/uncharacterized caspase-like protein